jgi:hypothetical protein
MPITKKLGDIEVVDANKIKAIEETMYDKTVLQAELDEIEGLIYTEKQNKNAIATEYQVRVADMNSKITFYQEKKLLIQAKLALFK